MNEIKRNSGNINFISGRLSLDFTNSIEWRGRDKPLELLINYNDLLTWSRRQSVLTDQKSHQLLEIADNQKELSFSVLKRAIVLREALYRIYSAIIQHQQPDQSDLTIFNQEVSAAMVNARVLPAADGFKWEWAAGENQLDQVLWPIVYDAATLLTSEMLSRLGMCSDKNCAWLFLDTSKNHKRRWCSMNDCGNRAKVQRHYKRNRLDNKKRNEGSNHVY